jgi:hypothetical protein|tara:strand:- start:137 stop:337 length:201 start_codon:yes stop_codon:yes gene_type:complete
MKWIRALWLLKNSTLSKEKPMDRNPNIEMKKVIEEIVEDLAFSSCLAFPLTFRMWRQGILRGFDLH